MYVDVYMFYLQICIAIVTDSQFKSDTEMTCLSLQRDHLNTYFQNSLFSLLPDHTKYCKGCLQKKQAENGLQSRSSENGKTAGWHYGLKFQ